MDTEKIRYFFRIGIALAATSVIFHIISFVSNGWSIYKLDSTTWYIGLWYLTSCDENGKCNTKSRRDGYEKYQSINSLVNYSYIVRWQMVETFSLCCSILCVVMILIGLHKHWYGKRIRTVVLTCSILSGTLLLHDLGMTLGEISISIQDGVAHYFPWALLTLFVAVLSILAVSCSFLSIEWKMSRSGNQQGVAQFQQSRKLTICGILFTSLSVAFRIVAFSSNAWRIIKSGGYTTYYGLWFLSKCRESDGCETMSVRTYYKDTPYNSYAYSAQVRSQVVLTLSLVLSMVCLVLLIIESRQLHSRSLMRLSILLTSLLSGTFWLYDVAHYMRIFVIDMENKYDYRIVYFPWSILFALLGTLFILTVSLLRFVKECTTSDLDQGELENILAMDISSNINDSELGDNNVDIIL